MMSDALPLWLRALLQRQRSTKQRAKMLADREAMKREAYRSFETPSNGVSPWPPSSQVSKSCPVRKS